MLALLFVATFACGVCKFLRSCECVSIEAAMAAMYGIAHNGQRLAAGAANVTGESCIQ